MADQGLSHQTIKSYLSATRFFSIKEGYGYPKMHIMATLEQALKGIKAVKARSGATQRERLPI